MHNAIAYSKRYELYSPILLLDWGEIYLEMAVLCLGMSQFDLFICSLSQGMSRDHL